MRSRIALYWITHTHTHTLDNAYFAALLLSPSCSFRLTYYLPSAGTFGNYQSTIWEKLISRIINLSSLFITSPQQDPAVHTTYVILTSISILYSSVLLDVPCFLFRSCFKEVMLYAYLRSPIYALPASLSGTFGIYCEASNEIRYDTKFDNLKEITTN